MNSTHFESSVALKVYEISAKHRTKIYKGLSNIGCCIHGNTAELLRYKEAFQLNTLTSVYLRWRPSILYVGLAG